jgi:putative redox protein
MRTEKIVFRGAAGQGLAARLDSPDTEPRAYALFAHCFTCGKDVFAASRIAQQLAEHGVAVLRFDFTGIGASEGDFANSNFSSNVADLVAAAGYLAQTRTGPTLVIGHSLGGAAILAAAGQIPSAAAVVTIAAPSDVSHVTGLFHDHVGRIESEGEAEVLLAGRPFRIKRQFLEDAAEQNLAAAVGRMRQALLVMHSPVDATVDISNATRIFTAAKHPKSFVSLNKADHLLTARADAVYAANVIAAWAGPYLPA